MGLPYECTFEISAPAADDGGSRLAGIVSLLREELTASSAATVSDIELEAGDAGGYGYAVLSTERPHPQLADQSMQLEVRLCAADGEPVRVNFRSRFISADGVDPPELRAGPPRLLRLVMERFGCSAGGRSIGQTATTIDAGSVPGLVTGAIFDADRALPILVCSERPDATATPDPELIQRELVGLAHVVRLRHEAVARFRELTGLACYNGAARWLWPGASSDRGVRLPNTYCSQPELARRDALYNLQQTALQRASASEFDSRYSHCRAEVILARNQILEAERQEAAPADGDAQLRLQLRREQIRVNEFSRRLEVEQGKVARLDQDLAEAHSRIEELEARVEERSCEEVPDSARELRSQIRVLRSDLGDKVQTISQLNAELQAYRQRERSRVADQGITLALGGAHPGWLTLCNHALNLYRDPMRRLIIGRLRESYDNLQLERQLRNYVDFSNRSVDYNTREPESSIDVGDFESLVESSASTFADAGLWPGQLRDIRRFRNRVSHPPVGGLDTVAVQDGLRNIREVLERIGARDAADEVRGLSNLVSGG